MLPYKKTIFSTKGIINPPSNQYQDVTTLPQINQPVSTLPEQIPQAPNGDVTTLPQPIGDEIPPTPPTPDEEVNRIANFVVIVIILIAIFSAKSLN